MERRAAGKLSLSERTALIEEVAFAVLEAALRSSSGEITIRIFNDEPTQPRRLEHRR